MPNLPELLRTLTAHLDAMALAKGLTEEEAAPLRASIEALGAGIEAHNQTAAEAAPGCSWHHDVSGCAHDLAEWLAECSPRETEQVLDAIRGRHFADLARILGG